MTYVKMARKEPQKSLQLLVAMPLCGVAVLMWVNVLL